MMPRSKSTRASEGPTFVTHTSTGVSIPVQIALLTTSPPSPDDWPRGLGHTEDNPEYAVWESQTFPGLKLCSRSIPDLSGSPESFGRTLMARLAGFDDSDMSRKADSWAAARRIVRDVHQEFGLNDNWDESQMESLTENRRTSSRHHGP